MLKSISLLCIASAICVAIYADDRTPLSYVEPRIGTAHSETFAAGMFGKGTEELGQTLPAVLEPNGMNFWTPQTRDTEQKCVAPYYDTDSVFRGFRNSHWIVGGCTQDYGSMTLMPFSGSARSGALSRGSRMDKRSEVSAPDYYSVILPDEGITAEMTGTSRAAIFRMTYSDSGNAVISVRPNSDEGEGYVEVDMKNRRIIGCNPAHRIYQGWGKPAGFSGWFVVEWEESLKVVDHGTYNSDSVFSGNEMVKKVPGVGAFIEFEVAAGDCVAVKAASSFTSIDGAIANLNAELPGFDFDAVRSRLAGIWDRQLGKIKVEGGTADELTKFYSALYRASFLPRAFSDVDGRYPRFGAGSNNADVMSMPEGRVYYEDYSMWDTYRALHPLLNIIAPSKSADMMQSLVLKYEQGGWLPIFPCWNSYTAAMVGDHCIAAIADAYVKGVRDFDVEKAYEGMRKNAFVAPADIADYRNGMGRRALDSYMKYGYVPVEDAVADAFHKKEQVSRTLEYAYDDFALAQMAKALGHDDDFAELTQRSLNYRNVINPLTGYAAPRDSSGVFLDSDPFSFSPHITEGAPCHYTWYVPHDQQGLMELMGGREAYAAKLDSMFTHGRYWHGNEPCHQVAWLFPYAGEAWRTQKYVRHIMDTEYLSTPGGLSGNDDAGQMSAWYVFAALGFYPVCPASPEYVIGSPVFPKAEITLESGKTFTIIADGASPDNIYVRSITLDGVPLDSPFLRHDHIMAGSVLKLTMSDTPRYK